MKRMPRHTLWVSIAGVLAVTAYAALAAVQILVLNPLAAAPGLTLDEIRAEMWGAGEDLGGTAVLVILGIGVGLAVVVALVAILARAQPAMPATLFLALLVCGVVAYFVASFGAGMALADTFMISGGDKSPWAIPLAVVSVLALVGLLVRPIMLSRRRTAAPALAD